jgi:hypothetical protein
MMTFLHENERKMHIKMSHKLQAFLLAIAPFRKNKSVAHAASFFS